MWRSFDKGNLDLCLKQPGEFFMVRAKGEHPGRGGKFVPSIVQLIDNQLYAADNELDAIIFSHKDDFFEPCQDPFECNLEWRELPD